MASDAPPRQARGWACYDRLVDDADRKARAEARRVRATIVRTRLGPEEANLDVRGADALSLVTRLTRAAWALRGTALPLYSRAEIPCRFVPREEVEAIERLEPIRAR